MRENTKKVLIGILITVIVITVIFGGCFMAFISNRDTINTQVDNLLDQRIAEYMNANADKYIGATGSTGARGEKGDAGDNGVDGADGKDGADGLTPYIGDNGNWWIGEVDTECPVTLESIQGEPGMSAYDVAVANGFEGTQAEWLASLCGADGRDGVDGQTPYIGVNNNWWIGTTDTGVKASNADPIIVYKKDIILTDNWVDTGICGGSLLYHGLYAYRVNFNNPHINLYQESLGGTLNWYSSNTNGENEVEIVPGNMAGHAKNGNTVQLRVIRPGNGELKLQIKASQHNTSSSTECEFLFRKLV